MKFTSTELADLVCTRLSHDLIGNIGALSGALELLEDSNNVLDDDTKNILTTATNTLKARQKFFRIAFGADTKKMELYELYTICQEYLNSIGSRNFPITFKAQNISAELGKIFCLCIMLAAEIVIKGGQINITVNPKNMCIDLQSDYKLSSPKIDIYQAILQDVKPQDNISQYIALIYLRELLGHDIPMHIDANENHFQLIIGQ